MDFDQVLLKEIDESLPLCREVVLDDAQFAQLILELTSRNGVPRPSSISNPQNVRANLSEFCVWELGVGHWQLFSKRFSWPACTDPWRDSPDHGIDILATDENVNTLMVLEVKSSQDDGSNLVNNQRSGLKGDFKSLFEGEGRTRLETRVLGDIAHSLRYHHNRPDLANKVSSLLGTSPSTSPNVKLIGVLVCSDEQAQEKRHRAFERLHTWLLEDDGDDNQKWQADQCRYFVIELDNLPVWLEHLLP
jgi:hypothetical protein